MMNIRKNVCVHSRLLSTISIGLPFYPVEDQNRAESRGCASSILPFEHYIYHVLSMMMSR